MARNSYYHEVARYKAKDGKEFKTQEGLEEYIADKLRSHLEKKTLPLLTDCGGITRKKQSEVILSIVSSFEDVRQLKELLDKYFD